MLIATFTRIQKFALPHGPFTPFVTAVLIRKTALLVLLSLSLSPLLVSATTTANTRPFKVIFQRMNKTTQERDYYAQLISGKERINNSLNRLSMVSESQYHYPQPESGCGPTAMLNILIWYEKFGLIEPFTRESNSRLYKQKLFKEIDRRITRTAGSVRTEEVGTASGDVAIVMDQIVREQSKGRLRIHTDNFDAPLQLKDLLQSMPNFRSGYLLVRPKNPRTKELMPPHAVTLMRADRAGYITIGTWGEVYRGLLKTRSGNQWFVPQDPKQHELQIMGLIRFTPFEPVKAASDS